MKNFGTVLISIGAAGLLWIGFGMITDMTGELARYSYKPPLTGHETANLIFGCERGAGILRIDQDIKSTAKGKQEVIRNSQLK